MLADRQIVILLPLLFAGLHRWFCSAAEFAPTPERAFPPASLSRLVLISEFAGESQRVANKIIHAH